MTKQTNTKNRPDKAAEAMAVVVGPIIEAIEAGASGEWVMPWQQVDSDMLQPANVVTGNPYTSGNRWALALTAMMSGYTSGTWATYKQWGTVGGQVRKHETSTRIVRPVELKPRKGDDESGPAEHDGSGGCRHDATPDDEPGRPRIVWRVFSVFNADQQDGWTRPDTPTDTRPPIEEAAALLDGWQTAGMMVIEGGNKACYRQSADAIQVPNRAQFEVGEHFYSTAFHEAIHWTAKRCDRNLASRFGDDAYAAEELVAELGAAMLGAHAGISQASRPDHAAYLAHWLKVLRADPKHLWTVASQAEKATRYLLELAGQGDK